MNEKNKTLVLKKSIAEAVPHNFAFATSVGKTRHENYYILLLSFPFIFAVPLLI